MLKEPSSHGVKSKISIGMLSQRYKDIFLRLLIALVVFAYLPPLALVAQEPTTPIGYSQQSSPFSKSGFNNVAWLYFLANIGDGGSFVFRCNDNVFLHYINPLGDSEDASQRVGIPGQSIKVKLSIDSEVKNISAKVSPTGLSFFGKELTMFSLDMIQVPGESKFAFSFQGRTKEIITAQFVFTAENKSDFSKVAANCSME